MIMSSLKAKISLLFLFAVISVGLVAAFVYFQKDFEVEKQVAHFVRASVSSAYNRETKELDLEELVSNGFVEVTDEDDIEDVLEEYYETSNRHVRGNGRGRGMMRGAAAVFNTSIVRHDSDFYVIMNIGGNNAIFQIEPFRPNHVFAYLFFISMGVLLALLYFLILKSIKPLRTLRDKIREFSNGDDGIDCRVKGKDEIAEVANEFDTAVKKIRTLRESRQLFLRNIMHELKTPIARGKLSVEMLGQQNPYREILSKVFVRQEYLLNEFARIEQLGTGEVKLDRNLYNIRDIIDHSLDIIGENAQNVEVDIDEQKIHADFDMLATAIKNLLDNALLYSSDKKAAITSKNGVVTITNNGNALEFTLEEYRKPFLLKGKKQKESRGFGFGLFISLKIFDLHNIKTEYKYKDGKNVFTLVL